MQYQNEDYVYHLDADTGGGGTYQPGVGVESGLGRRLGVESGLGRRNNLAKSLRWRAFLTCLGTSRRLVYLKQSEQKREIEDSSGSNSTGFPGKPGGSEGKASACNVGDPGSIPGWGRFPGEGNGNPLQYLAWKIPWMEEPGRLQSMGWQRVKHD